MSLVVPNLYASDDRPDDDINLMGNRVRSFKGYDEETKRQMIEYKISSMTPEEQQHILNFLVAENGSKKAKDLKSGIASLNSQKLTALYFKINQLEDQRAEAVYQPSIRQGQAPQLLPNLFMHVNSPKEEEQEDEPSNEAGPSQASPNDSNVRDDYIDDEVAEFLKNRPTAVYHAPELPPANPNDRLKWAQSRQIEHQLDREREVFGLQDRALAAQVAGLERGEREDAELFGFKKRMITAQTARAEREEREQEGVSELKKRALNVQIQREEAALKRENPSFGEFVKRPEFVISMAVTLGEPVYRLCVERYGHAVFGFIEEKLGFGPSEQEKQFVMAQMMNNAALKSRLTRAELNEKELKVSILRAALKKQEIEAEKEELQMEVIRKKNEIWADIVDLTRQEIHQGPNFSASDKKKLARLKEVYKEGQMIDQRLQDLKKPTTSGTQIPGLA